MIPKPEDQRLTKSYFEQVKLFPLVCIRDDEHLRRASAKIDELLCQDLDDGQEEYVNALTDLVETYERIHVPLPETTEGETLQLLMELRGINQSALSKEVGIAQPTICSVLRGARSLTKEQVIKLAKFFHVGPGVFLPGC